MICGSQPRRSGTHEEDQAVVILPYSDAYTPRVGDRIRDNASTDQWTVRQVRVEPSPIKPHEWFLKVDRYKS